jgi:hypothetical protein
MTNQTYSRVKLLKKLIYDIFRIPHRTHFEIFPHPGIGAKLAENLGYQCFLIQFKELYSAFLDPFLIHYHQMAKLPILLKGNLQFLTHFSRPKLSLRLKAIDHKI